MNVAQEYGCGVGELNWGDRPVGVYLYMLHNY